MYARPKGRPGRPPPKPTLTIARFTTLPVAAVAVLVAVPLALAAALPGGGKYAGKTDDAQAVTLRLTSDAKRVKKMRIHYTVTCNDGRSGETYTDILNPKIRSDHSFRGSGTYKGSGDGSENAFKVTGTVSAKKASGTFSLTATSESEAQGETLRCKTGKLTWSAKRQR
jgi:hypothetical protein